tara:strand:+ start:696 stop:1580 length:885 start_codon:yes stop_codon:yes gene_type:complete
MIKSSSPRVMASKVSSKRDVENDLMRTIDQIVFLTLQQILTPMLQYLSQSAAFVSQSQGKAMPLHQQPFATIDKVKGIYDSVGNNMEKVLPDTLASASLYLSKDCASAEENLQNTIMNNIIQQFSRFYSLIERHYDAQEADKVGLPPLHATEEKVKQYFGKKMGGGGKGITQAQITLPGAPVNVDVGRDEAGASSGRVEAAGSRSNDEGAAAGRELMEAPKEAVEAGEEATTEAPVAIEVLKDAEPNEAQVVDENEDEKQEEEVEERGVEEETDREAKSDEGRSSSSAHENIAE